ncbi:thermonuclease family protein [Streptomyces violaceus]|uniref:thermonuclease family protein n=1 Tax=Streptomyces violaceus TaxID=1936 RepID=UPI002E20B8AD
MPMVLIEGVFRLKGTGPDGDTVRFVADNPADWNLVSGKNPLDTTAAGEAKIRLEGIDALETHYHGSHQPLTHANAAAAELLSWLGFTDVQRDAKGEVISSTPETTPGFVLSRGADNLGRCVALVGKGNAPAASGSDITVDVPLLKETVNHHLVTEGLAYPTFYRSLFMDLRLELTAAAKKASDDGKGLWPDDVTTTGAKITGLSSIVDDVVILPKLFRRLVDYFALGTPSIACFPAYLAGKEDPFTILSTNKRRLGLHHVVEVTNGNTLRMTHAADDLLFDEG